MNLKDKLKADCGQCMLSKLCLPAGIDQQDLQRLHNLVHTNVRLEKAAHLLRAGQTLSDLYVVSSGALKTVSLNAQGTETVLGFHLPGELVGLDALSTGAHLCDSIALCDSRVCKIPVSRLEEASSAIPGLQRQLFRLMGRCVGRDQAHNETLVRVQAMERVARFLIELAQRYRTAGFSDDQFHLPMSRQDIANFLGVALETVSRNFTRLQDDGVLEVSGRRVLLKNRARLREIGELDPEPFAAAS